MRAGACCTGAGSDGHQHAPRWSLCAQTARSPVSSRDRHTPRAQPHARVARGPSTSLSLSLSLSLARARHWQALSVGIEVVDVRLLVIRDRLYTLGTYPARSYASAVAPLRIRRRAGLRELLAWQLPGEMLHLRRGVCSGRSQAFFEHGNETAAAGTTPRLFFQSWLVPAIVCEVRPPDSRPRSRQGPLGGMTAAQRYESVGLEAAATQLAAGGTCASAAASSGRLRVHAGAAAMCRLSLNGVLVGITLGPVDAVLALACKDVKLWP